jgi:hypothetical protein
MTARFATTEVFLAFVLMVSVCLLPNCKGCSTERSSGDEGRPALGTVMVLAKSSVDSNGLPVKIDEQQLSTKVKSLLENAGVFAAPQSTKKVANVSLEVEVFGDGPSEATEIGTKVRLRVALRPTTAGPMHFIEDIAAIGQAPLATGRNNDDTQSSFQRLAERTAEDLTHAYVRRQKLWEAPVSEITAALQPGDDEMLVEALRIIGARKMRDQVPAVLRFLSNDDESVRDAALGVLVALRERGAVKALAQSREMRDAREMRKILDAIATMGGQEAKEFLGFVAETHDDDEIRDMARSALERLLRRDESWRPTK